MSLNTSWAFWAGVAGVLLGIALIIVRSRSLMDAILDLQVRVPRDPLAIFGTILVFASAGFLVILKLTANGG